MREACWRMPEWGRYQVLYTPVWRLLATFAKTADSTNNPAPQNGRSSAKDSSCMSAHIEQVKIPSGGLLCAGTFLRHSAQPAGSKAPAVLLSHGFACVRTMRNLPEVASALVDAGIAALTLDFRF